MARNKRQSKHVVARKPRLLVVADGKTEINYFRGLFKEYSKIYEHYEVEFKGNMINTYEIYNLIKISGYKYDYIFALSDKDNANNKDDVFNNFCYMDKCYDNLITGYTNPCFEFWLLLHSEYRSVEISTKELIVKFKKQIGKNYKSNNNIFSYFIDNLEVAVTNSEKLKLFWKDNNKSIAKCNPITNIHEIVKYIIQINNDL